MAKNIYLVGFMGTGKTSVGNLLSQALGLQFLDLDENIEKNSKMKIKDIFDKFGEEHFRMLEKKSLKTISEKPGFVVSCGGGIVLDPDNIDIMRKSGHIICLNASIDVIIERTKGSEDRPLLNVPDARQRIEDLMKKRALFYSEAEYSIDTSFLSVKEVCDKIKDFLYGKED